MNGLLFGKKCLKKRVEAVVCRRVTRRSAAVLTAVLCLLTAGCTFTDAPETTLAPQPTQTVEPTENTTEPVAAYTEPYDVVKEALADILTPQEEAILRQIPDVDWGESWNDGFGRNVRMRKFDLSTAAGVTGVQLVSAEEIADDRAEPGVRVYEIRYRQELVDGTQDHTDYLICGEHTAVWTSDLDGTVATGLFNG